MKTLCILQHIEAEYLGLLEDHLESRNIRFHYVRPFTPGGVIPSTVEGFDGLILLGAGQYGIVSGDLIPSLGPELRLATDFLARRRCAAATCRSGNRPLRARLLPPACGRRPRD